jgi:type IV pilus biogenesis protein PilP
MFYKIVNFRTSVVIAGAVLLASSAVAQGLVSLSEEAMFDDELESNQEAPKAPEAPTVDPASEQQDAAKTPSDEEAQASTPSAPASDAQPFAVDAKGLFTDSEDDSTSNEDLFKQMSDLEKKTALLNMELRREKLQTEIESVKNARRQALQAEADKVEAARLKRIEAEKAKEKEVLVEQEKLRNLDIKFETLRQEKILGAYKNKMLEENQKWIANNAEFYKQIADLRQARKSLAEDSQKKFDSLKAAAAEAQNVHSTKIEAYKKEAKSLRTQIDILRSRIASLEKEREEAKRNPFAGQEGAAPTSGSLSSETSEQDAGGEPQSTELSKLYAVTEIRGLGGELVAKLINKSGTTFYVKKGTMLQSGHVVGDITLTYVAADKDGERQYLYFAAGGTLPVETPSLSVVSQDDAADRDNASRR